MEAEVSDAHASLSRAGAKKSAVLPHPIAFYGTVQGFLAGMLCGVQLGYGFEPAAIARSLTTSGQFANPYAAMPTSATAHMPPLYPALLAILLRLTGDNQLFLWSVVLVTAIAFGVLVRLLPPLSKSIFGDEKIGETAAWLAILIPAFKPYPGWDAIFGAAMLAGFCLFVLRRPSSWIAGLFLGGLALLNPACAVFGSLWLLGVFGRCRRFGGIAGAFLVAGLMCAPWALRNHAAVGTWSIRDNLGLELLVSNNDWAAPNLMSNAKSFERFHPNSNRMVAEQVRTVGESAFNAQSFSTAVHWVRTHPKRFLVLTLQRFALFWFPAYRDLPFSFGVWVMTVLSIPAALLYIRKREYLPILLIASMLIFSLPYFVIQADLRYRIPVLWVTVLLVGKTVSEWHSRFRAART